MQTCEKVRLDEGNKLVKFRDEIPSFEMGSMLVTARLQ